MIIDGKTMKSNTIIGIGVFGLIAATALAIICGGFVVAAMFGLYLGIVLGAIDSVESKTKQRKQPSI